MIDAFDQNLRAADYCRGLPSVSFALSIPLGPRGMKAGLTLAYEGQYPLAFKSVVAWPQTENFESAIRSGILDVLLKDGSPIIGGIFQLVSVQIDPIDSSEVSFRLAAREAARSLISILQMRTEPNQSLQTMTTAVTCRAAHAPRPLRSCLI
jgi:hypothetical protein